jgi:hypothetical protein
VPYASASGSKSVTVLSVTVRFDATNKDVKPGDLTTFSGVVLVDSSPGVSRSVSIQISIGGTWREITRVTTNPYGAFTYTWTVPWTVDTTKLPCNSWSFRAVDVSSGTASDTITITVRYPTRLSVSTDKDQYAPGDTVTVTVLLEYQDSDGNWKPLAYKSVTITAFGTSKTVTTGSDGKASTTFTAPSTPGTYTIQATFAGGTLAFAPATAAPIVVGAAPVAQVVVLAVPLLVGGALLVATAVKR